ncbi:DMT family transporter [Clostridium massiliamazoniense]|uniref:DMT family transporter n=1 Tax=Clostridium massiliamazoniense TaxID=1347366 RepID=UPI0006D776BC|nr:DMT family transporter [Clostridium massiliamazoniense]
MNNKTKAILLIITSALSFAIMSTLVKLSGNLPPFEKSFFRNIVSLIVAFYLIVKNNSSYFGKKENRSMLLLRSILGTLGIWANFYAIDNLILPNATILNQLSPFFVIIFSYLFLKEKIKLIHIISLLTAFIGVIFIVRPTSGLTKTLLASLIGISSAIFAGGAYTCVRYLSTREKSYTIVFMFSFISVLSTIPFMIFDFVLPSILDIIYLLLAGVFASIAQFSLTTAYKYAPAKEISIFSYSQIIFTTLIGFLIWTEIPGFLSIIGYLLVIISSLIIFLYNNKKSISKIKN